MLGRMVGPQARTLLCLCAVLPWIQSCTGPPPTPIRTAQEGITLTKAGRPIGVDLFLLMDESGSMYGEGGNHPQQLRRWIQHYVDPTMHGLLDVTATALLHDLEVFQLYALCYTMELLPTRQGGSATTPQVYYLGHTELASVLDLDALSCRLLCTHYQVDGVWQRNEAVHQALRELWRTHEAEQVVPEKLEAWLARMQQRADRLELPLAGQALIHREHLRKALQAAVY